MTDTSNRVLWTIIAVILTALGVLGVLAHLGKLSFVYSDDALLSSALIGRWHQGDPWNLYVLIAIGLLIAVIGLRLFVKEFRRRGAARMGDVTLPSGADDRPGRTVVQTPNLVRAFEKDLDSGSAISKAAVVLTGDSDRPHASIRIDLAPGATVATAHEQVDAALDRFTTTSGLTPDPVDVTVRPNAGTEPRVH